MRIVSVVLSLALLAQVSAQEHAAGQSADAKADKLIERALTILSRHAGLEATILGKVSAMTPVHTPSLLTGPATAHVQNLQIRQPPVAFQIAKIKQVGAEESKSVAPAPAPAPAAAAPEKAAPAPAPAPAKAAAPAAGGGGGKKEKPAWFKPDNTPQTVTYWDTVKGNANYKELLEASKKNCFYKGCGSDVVKAFPFKKGDR